MVRESIEKKILKKEDKEKSIIEKLNEIRVKEIERAKEDKSLTGWSLISPELLTNGAKELFSHYEKGEFESAQEELKKVLAETKEIKKEKARTSNENFVHWIDDKIGAEITKKELEAEREKDNY